MTSDVIEPDGKDWTWVLREPCPECAFVAADVDPTTVGPVIGTHVERWQRVLARADVAVRPQADRWSDLEYACHVRDVFSIFAGRVDQMLAEDPAHFANWDQDAAALENGYAHADPVRVGEELAVEGRALSDTLARVGEGDWARRGLRSNGSEFTTATLAQYLLHDLEHHLVDVDG